MGWGLFSMLPGIFLDEAAVEYIPSIEIIFW